jgi:hypothetical protein
MCDLKDLLKDAKNVKELDVSDNLEFVIKELEKDPQAFYLPQVGSIYLHNGWVPLILAKQKLTTGGDSRALDIDLQDFRELYVSESKKNKG